MPIDAHYFDSLDRLWFNVATHEFEISEAFAGSQLLVMNPELVELYKFIQTLGTYPVVNALAENRIQTKEKRNVVPRSLQQMVIECIDVEHYSAALDLSETILSSNREPSSMMMAALVHVLLEKSTKTTNPRVFREQLVMLERTRNFLINSLRQCGAHLFNDLWTTFSLCNNGPMDNYVRHQPFYSSRTIVHDTSKQGSDDDEDNDYKGFIKYQDLWDLISACLKSDDPHQSPLFLLEVVLVALETEYWQKRESHTDMMTTALMKSFKQNNEGQWHEFGRNLDLLFAVFESSPTDIIQQRRQSIAFRLFNLMISLGYYDGLLSASSLAMQTYQRASKLSADQLLAMFREISFDAFTLQLCQYGIASANWSEVPKSHKEKRKMFATTILNIATVVDNWEFVVLRTKPVSMNIERIYWHLIWATEYYRSMISVYSYRWTDKSGARVINAYEDDDIDLNKVLGFFNTELFIDWRFRIESWLEAAPDAADKNHPRRTDITCILNRCMYIAS
ncbi:hypothetical protein BC940DRAFT_292609 [Gongronella butleri]|nr:hypothetical protein BC940DRAFT_292609 [Gongronella butleri]